MSKINGKNVSQVIQAIYVNDTMPADVKMITPDYTYFQNTLPEKSKWDGMLVFVQSVGRWHQYDLPTDTLIPFGGSGSTIVIENGFRLIWKYPGNINKLILEPNDIIEGFVENVFIKGKFVAGPENLKSSYVLLEEYTM